MDDRRLPDVPQDGADAAATDDQLLRQFLATRDELAFRRLVDRYGSLVLGVCTRILRQRHDAEEAFQATFLVLAQKAARVQGGRSLGPWLYGVAYRIAIRAHQRRARRHMDSLPENVATIDEALEGVWDVHWRRALDDALHELPEKLRAPLVLHYLRGKTNNEVAVELGLSVRAVEGRQRRGKALLKRRLALRKVALPMAVSAVAASFSGEAAATEASAVLVEATVSASLAFVTGTSAAGGEGALRLAQNEVSAMTSNLAPMSVAAALVMVIGAAGIGVGGHAIAEGGDAQPLSAAVQAAAAGDASLDLDVAVQTAAFNAGEPEELGLLSYTADGGPDLYRAHQLSDAERKIFAAIESARTTLEFAETPLNRIMAFLSDEHAIPIYFDTRALEAIAVSPDVEVTVNLRDLPLRTALRLLLREVGDLTYVVRDDVLLITTEEEAQDMLETHVYDVSQILETVGTTVAELERLIPGTIAADMWETNGSGEGTIALLGDRHLVITQPQAVHEQIAGFLRQLEASRSARQSTTP